jgi:hypothetical protein
MYIEFGMIIQFGCYTYIEKIRYVINGGSLSFEVSSDKSRSSMYIARINIPLFSCSNTFNTLFCRNTLSLSMRGLDSVNLDWLVQMQQDALFIMLQMVPCKVT